MRLYRNPLKYLFPGCLCALALAAAVSLTGIVSQAETLADATNVTGAQQSDAAADTSAPSVPPTLWVVGDSTAAEFQDNYYYPRYGWGTQLYRYFQGIEIRNLAVSGTSSKSYLETEQYQTLLSGMKAGDYLIIGFGHNDEKAESGRYTNPNTSISTPGSIQYYLYESYIRPAREAGVTPVLCTPIVRRDRGDNYTGESGHIISDQTTVEGTFSGGDYAKAIQMAGVAKSVPVLNLTRRTREIYEQLGAYGVRNRHAWLSSRDASIDNTHTNLYGAACNAWLIADELSRTGCTLKNYLTDNLAPPDPSILVPNTQYQSNAFQRPSSDSVLWSSAGDWKGTVFGDIGAYEYLNPVYFTLLPYENGAIQIAAGRSEGRTDSTVGASVGKISTATDGIAMYYQAVPADRNFVLSANVTINHLDANNQASFGLMVRDDIYVDTVSNDTLGDYVAAAPLMMGSSDPWNCFARKSGVLTRGNALTRRFRPGETLRLTIRKSSDGYTCTLDDQTPVSAGFDFPLTAADPGYVYAGMFVARSADVSFWDISLTLE